MTSEHAAAILNAIPYTAWVVAAIAALALAAWLGRAHLAKALDWLVQREQESRDTDLAAHNDRAVNVGLVADLPVRTIRPATPGRPLTRSEQDRFDEIARLYQLAAQEPNRKIP